MTLRKKQLEAYLRDDFSIYELNYEDISEDVLKEKLEERVIKDIRYEKIEGLSMTIKKRYRVYYIMESEENIYNYALINAQRNHTSTVESRALFIDPNLIKAGLYTNKLLYETIEFKGDITVEDIIQGGYLISNFEKDYYFIAELKAKERICEKHRIHLYEKGYRMDVDFYNMSYKRKWIILEPVYEISIPYQYYKRSINNVCIYSLPRAEFDLFAYPHSKEYMEYLKTHKSFFPKIGPSLDDYYYRDCYDVHLEREKETSNYRLKQHVRSFSTNENEEIRNRYSKVGYFFFNNKKCLPNAVKKSDFECFNEKLYNLVLLSKVDGDANFELAEMAEKHLLGKVRKSGETRKNYLIQSAKLKNKKAYLELYNHYSREAYKDDSLANYYLKLSKEE